MSAAERRKLARSLARMDYPHPMVGVDLSRRRRVAALISVLICAALAGWIVVLTLTLHKSFHAHYWRVAWVGFDVIELLAFAATGWAMWRGRQIAIAFLLVTGTLLCCDAWFDVILDSGTRDVWGSLASAVFVELPLAFLMFNAARRLIRLSALVAVSESAGDSDCERPQGSRWVPPDDLPPLWKIPLFGVRQLPSGRDRASSS